MNQSTTTSARFSGLAWTALILGIVGVVGSVLPIFNNLTALAAAVGLVLGLIATFGTRPMLAVTGATLCVLAIVFTVIAQNRTVAALSGRDPSAMSDVSVSSCSVSNDFGTPFSHATITIMNSTDHTQSYMATVSVNNATGARVSEINAFSNALGAHQAVTLSGPGATGNVTGPTDQPLTCVVAKVNRFAS
jgi:hypothetical protein